MMRQDIKIAIAYGSDAMLETARKLRDKLNIYQSFGYPVNASLIDEDIRECQNFLSSNDNKEKFISDAMEKYFTNFDYAIFLFDIKGVTSIETKKGKVKKQSISPNLLFEYGLATSVFNNHEQKRVFCFAPKRIEEDVFRYIKSIKLHCFDELIKENANDPDVQADFIIQNYIHCQEYINPCNGDRIEQGIYFLFYGLKKKLPKIFYDNQKNYYIEDSIIEMKPMENNVNNKYWADLRKLQISGNKSALDQQSKAISKLFKEEYNSFSIDDESEMSFERRLLFIIDRAVLIMYLRVEDYWDNIVFNGFDDNYKRKKSLLDVRKEQLNDNESLIKDDYLIKATNALHGVFLYQQCCRPVKNGRPSLITLKTEKQNIINMLEPIVNIGPDTGNRMLYCLAADYLALIYHKDAMYNIAKFIGDTNFYINNNVFLLKKKLSVRKLSENESNIIKTVLMYMNEAIKLLSSVVGCQKQMQEKNNGYRYIWKSYALYNQSRCEYIVHLITALGKKEKSLKKIDDVYKDKWCENLKNAVISRKSDYEFFKARESFPKIIAFNLEAEYYHAYYEYELTCFIEKYFSPEFNFDEIGYEDNFQQWRDSNLLISDVLSVDQKVKQVYKLKEEYYKSVIDSKLSEIQDEQTRDEIRNIIQPLKEMALSNDLKGFEKEKIKADKEIGVKLGASLDANMTASIFCDVIFKIKHKK